MKTKHRVLVTGATGFVGGAVLSKLREREQFILSVALRSSRNLGGCDEFVVGDFNESTCWVKALTNQQTVIHAAALTNIIEGVTDPISQYRRVNVAGTLGLARQAAEAGVKRFIFISSIKVNGEQTEVDSPFSEEDIPAPEDAYALSKLEAEQGLIRLAADTGMEVVIIRPPLVYGPRVKGNFRTMINMVRKGIPLPLGSVSNARSLVAIDNLVDLILTCVEHPAAANHVFLVSDGCKLSTTILLKKIGEAIGRPACLLPVPVSLLGMFAALLGKKAVARRLLKSLVVDSAKAQRLLGWEPVVTVEEGLRRCIHASDI